MKKIDRKIKIDNLEIEDLGFEELSEEEDELITKMIDEAEKEIESKTKPLTIRMPLSQIERFKKIAAKKGLPYQTYIKSILKQALDKEEDIA
ncbi:MAG: hypothetical protein A2Y25_11330 [Candidatus Melainabacteria bacterium GWF2_37_15]|nr:MAG: hypothetical protein A2Y25_11330 [Candidatus Melainabacteria bacterium GWF2_37_15]